MSFQKGKRKAVRRLCCLSLLLALPGCAFRTAPPPAEPTFAEDAAEDPVVLEAERLLSGMSREDKVWQMLVLLQRFNHCILSGVASPGKKAASTRWRSMRFCSSSMMRRGSNTRTMGPKERIRITISVSSALSYFSVTQ